MEKIDISEMIFLKALEEKIKREGKVLPGGVLKVDGFINHRIDVEFLNEMGKEFYRLFGNEGISKILTVEASGIGIACITAQYFKVPVVFAKKSKTSNISPDVYSSPVMSFTHGIVSDIVVSKQYLSSDDKVLIIDDFLAVGNALKGLLSVCRQAGAEVKGCGIVIEKAFQHGGNELRSKGVRIESLAKIRSMTDTDIVFCD